MSELKYKISAVKDKNDKHYTDKGDLPNVPFKILCVGKSHYSGKTTILYNFLTKKEFYSDNFLGPNIYIISASIGVDDKITNLIKEKSIPNFNQFKSFDEKMLSKTYKMIEEKFKLAVSKDEPVVDSIFVFDDASFDGSLKSKQYGVYNKVFMNGRHINLSCFTTAQAYVDVPLNARRNLTALLVFNISEKDLDIVNDEHNYIGDKKEFKKKFRDSLKGSKHNFFVVNYSNDTEKLYQNSNFIKI